MTGIQILATIGVGIDITILLAALTWPEPHRMDPADARKPAEVVRPRGSADAVSFPEPVRYRAQ